MVMQSHYSTAAASLTGLDPTTISSPRTAQNLLVAHLVFKCVVKIASWVYARLKSIDLAGRLEGWVSCELFVHAPVLTRFAAPQRFPQLRRSAPDAERGSYQPRLSHTLRRGPGNTSQQTVNRDPHATHASIRQALQAFTTVGPCEVCQASFVQ